MSVRWFFDSEEPIEQLEAGVGNEPPLQRAEWADGNNGQMNAAAATRSG
jgi:hypothetical protein